MVTFFNAINNIVVKSEKRGYINKHQSNKLRHVQ